MQDAQRGAKRGSGDAVLRCPAFLPGRRPVHSPAPRVLALSSGPWAQLRVGKVQLCFLPTAGTSGIPRPQRAKLVLCLLEPWASSCQEGSPLRQARALGRLLGPDSSCSGLDTGPGTRTAFLPSDLLPSPRAGKFSSHGA